MNFNWHPVVLGACLGLLLAIFVRSCGGAEATVFWDCAACPSIRGYAVFVRGDTGTVRYDTGTNTMLTLTNLQWCSSYTVTVVALATNGNDSEPSAPLTFSTPPAPPTNVRVQFRLESASTVTGPWTVEDVLFERQLAATGQRFFRVNGTINHNN